MQARKQFEENKKTTLEEGDFHTLDDHLKPNQDPQKNSAAAEQISSNSGGIVFSWERFDLETPNYVNYICWRGLNPMGDTTT